jgi:hypothetical protein
LTSTSTGPRTAEELAAMTSHNSAPPVPAEGRR